MRAPGAARTTRHGKSVPREIDYPSTEGLPLAESSLHIRVILDILARLLFHYRKQKKVFIGVNQYLYYREGDPKARRAPDIMIVKGLAPIKNRTSYFMWRYKIIPSCIIEVTSPGTAQEDFGPKKLLYQQLGIREYLIYDLLKEYLTPSLVGFRLQGGVYKPISPDPKGGLVSEELGLRLVPEEEDLGLWVVKTGKRLLIPAEAYETVDTLQRQLKKLEGELARLRKKK